MSTLNRRKFITSLGVLSAALPLGASAFDFVPSRGKAFQFVLLGDLHFDKMEHHDLDYVRQRFGNGDISQIENYSRITRQNLPALMNIVKTKGKALNADFYLQLGDFVEGLCGSEELAQRQTNEFIALVAEQQLNRPFFVVKGNHDITGEGAKETYIKTVLPWQVKEQKQAMPTANSTFVHKNARFVIFDGYSPDESLQWLKGVLESHKEEMLFFCVHQPVVPFNARSNWHVFGKPGQEASREELLHLLGEHRAIVLCGHLHKTNILTRKTATGKFVQVCTGSVIPSADAPIKDHLEGTDLYGIDLVNLEPKFSPASLEERKSNLEKEKPYIGHFEYADFCGYSTVAVSAKNEAVITIYANLDHKPWKSINVSALLKG